MGTRLGLLTLILDFSRVAGGFGSELLVTHMSLKLFLNDAFGSMGWSDYMPPTLKTVAFGFIIAATSCFLGYTVTGGATGVGHASTRSVAVASLS